MVDSPGRTRSLVSRRSVLQRLGAGALTASFTTLWAPRWVGASDLSLSDRIDLLYSNQFHFNERGEPQLTIGLMQGQTKVRLSAPGGLRVLPSGDGGTTIEGGSTFDIELSTGEPSKQRFSIVLEELTGPAIQSLDTVMQRWRSKGVDPEDHEVGTVFGVRGRVLDTRRILITTGRFGSESTAREHARRLESKLGALGKLHPQIERRGRGGIVARSRDSGLQIKADGVLWFAPARDEPIVVHDTLHGTTTGPGRREDRRYWGSVYVAIDRHGKLSVVNLVSESDVLAGLVPAEIYASAPMAALQAQAIAARGQLVSKVGTRHLDDPFLLCAEQHCQVYAGMMREHPRTTRAVRDTVGWLAMRPGGRQLVDTVYSANSGGHSENNEAVWPSSPDPQLRGRADPLVPRRFADGIDAQNLRAWLTGAPSSYSRPAEDSRNVYRWVETLDPAAIAGRHGVPKRLGVVHDITVLARGTSGRATALRLTGTAGVHELQGEFAIRQALGGLKSSMFLVAEQRDQFGRFVLRGGGHGHGVGMCQHGAIGMADAGRTHRDILTHYYRGCELSKLW